MILQCALILLLAGFGFIPFLGVFRWKTIRELNPISLRYLSDYLYSMKTLRPSDKRALIAFYEDYLITFLNLNLIPNYRILKRVKLNRKLKKLQKYYKTDKAFNRLKTELIIMNGLGAHNLEDIESLILTGKSRMLTFKEVLR